MWEGVAECKMRTTMWGCVAKCKWIASYTDGIIRAAHWPDSFRTCRSFSCSCPYPAFRPGLWPCWMWRWTWVAGPGLGSHPTQLRESPSSLVKSHSDIIFPIQIVIPAYQYIHERCSISIAFNNYHLHKQGHASHILRRKNMSVIMLSRLINESISFSYLPFIIGTPSLSVMTMPSTSSVLEGKIFPRYSTIVNHISCYC